MSDRIVHLLHSERAIRRSVAPRAIAFGKNQDVELSSALISSALQDFGMTIVALFHGHYSCRGASLAPSHVPVSGNRINGRMAYAPTTKSSNDFARPYLQT